MNEPIEGWFVITYDDLIFEVKGVIHPRNRIIAYVRYVPDIDGERGGHRKVYNLHEREVFLKEKFPDYLWYSNNHGRILQSVPRNMVKSYLNPIKFLDYVKSEGNENAPLSIATVDLIDRLVKITGIKKSQIGVTGSQLANVAIESSDIDLVVYGEKTCRRFYDILRELYNRVPYLEQYSGKLLDTHVNFRWGELENYYPILREIENRKFLQGIFDKYQFFIRLVKRPKDIKKSYGEVLTKLKGFCSIECIVTDISDSIFTPCEYLIKSLDYPEIRKLISYRGRFTEQLSEGVTAKARGRLEEVTDTKKD